jgi:hypothetical protein
MMLDMIETSSVDALQKIRMLMTGISMVFLVVLLVVK